MEKTELEYYSLKATQLFEKSRKVISGSGIDNAEELSARVPDTLFRSKERPLSVVFAGQYSAGKSSLIQILTGRGDIRVGEGITTQKATAYDWNGIRIVDTPGIGTDHNQEHDAVAREAISQADLIVYMISRKGFNDRLADDFQDIAIDMGKIHEMMLVVNKMKDTNDGNTQQQRDIVFDKNIYPVCQPRTDESLYTTFMDLKSYGRAQDPQLAKYREQLLADSGIEVFYKNFDRFMREKGHIGSMTTQLYTLYQVLSDAVGQFKGDGSVEDATIHLLTKKSRFVNEAILDIQEWFESKVASRAADIIALREEIIDEADEKGYETANESFKNKQLRLPGLYAAFEKELTEYIDQRMAQLENELGDMFSDSFAEHLKEQVRRLIQELKSSSKNIGSESSFSPDKYQEELSKGIDKGVEKVVDSRKQIHDYILKRGHSKGRKFKPHEANKEANKFIEKVSKGGKYVKIGLIVAVVGYELYNEYKDYKTAKAINEIKAQIRTFFEEEAKYFTDRYQAALDEFIDEQLRPVAKDCSDRIGLIRKHLQDTNNDKNQLYELMEKTNALIEELHEDF